MWMQPIWKRDSKSSLAHDYTTATGGAGRGVEGRGLSSFRVALLQTNSTRLALLTHTHTRTHARRAANGIERQMWLVLCIEAAPTGPTNGNRLHKLVMHFVEHRKAKQSKQFLKKSFSRFDDKTVTYLHQSYLNVCLFLNLIKYLFPTYCKTKKLLLVFLIIF